MTTHSSVQNGAEVQGYAFTASDDTQQEMHVQSQAHPSSKQMIDTIIPVYKWRRCSSYAFTASDDSSKKCMYKASAADPTNDR
ncbi:hypothetical protein JTE90_001447 [Oedothorax gibbosus]|uniref:Uncharacterized protein n=1 Tax=Oedothorax gibbosus TaxID=931172 RepID=A0AAV6TUK1_9ARAC|nr:hypothetical protein JTE90_001447 [Oedothorax gibbosus]